MVSYDVIWAVPLQLAPAMFWLDAHILRASSSTVWACTSKRPAIDRISCGSVIKREGISLSPYSCSLEITRAHWKLTVAATQMKRIAFLHHLVFGACPLVGTYTMAGM